MVFPERAPRRCAARATTSILILFVLACLRTSSQTLLIRADRNHSIRFAVAFNEQQKEEVKHQALQQGYQILAEGPGFITVCHQSLVVPPAPAISGAVAGRRLIEQMQRRHVGKHLKKLSSITGVVSSEQDVRRHLHLRPSFIRLFHHRTSRQLSAAGSDTAAAGHMAEYSREAGVRQRSSSSSQHPSGLLVGHWHLNQSRYRQFPPGRYDIWGNSVGDPRCASLDTQLSDAAGAEMVPWGMKRIGAWNSTLQNAAPKGRVIVCIIDSGLWANHPEYRSTSGPGIHDTVDGCKISPNCPYTWSEDIVGHGTHVAGTIGAPQNGLGVVGVIAKGADYHIVRIWNDSGDVGQGQGPYATDLILAYDNCLGHLEEQQKKDKGTKMVINMSFGSAGPLTVERLWITKAAQRGDILFVGSAGNNGSWYRPADSNRGGKMDPGQYLSYPASYDIPEMISVANARCDNTIDYSSQKNKRVSIAAPGMAILSSVPQQYAAVRAYITTNKPLPNQTVPKPTASRSRSNSRPLPFALGGFSGTGGGIAAPGETRRGLGFLPNGYREPRPIQGSQLGSTGMLPLVPCNLSADTYHFSEYGYTKLPTDQAEQREHEIQGQLQQPGCKGVSDAVCLVELPGLVDWYKETCLAMLQCLRGGGKGLVLWRNDQLMDSLFSSTSDLDYPDQDNAPDEFLLGTQMDCGLNCPCWVELQKLLQCKGSAECAKKAPPAVVVSSKHAHALSVAAAGGAAAGSAGSNSSNPKSHRVVTSSTSVLSVNVTNYEYPYRHYDGTSMSAPHVSGGAALLWRLFPNCPAAVIAEGLHKSAEKLPEQTSDNDLAAGSGMLRVDRAHDWLQRNKDCART